MGVRRCLHSERNRVETHEEHPNQKTRSFYIWRHGDAFAIALIFPALTALGFGVGYLLDLFFRTGPWLAVACTLVGSGLAFVALFEIGSVVRPGS